MATTASWTLARSPSKEKQGDDWLARELPALLSSAAFTNRGAIFLTWDEGHNSRPIGLIVLSPLAKGHGYTNDISYTHSSLLRTVQEIFAVRPLLGDAANATDLSDLFGFDSPSLSVVLDFTNGLARLSLSGLSPGRTNVIQTSTNLADWLPLHTNVATATTLQFTDTINTNGPRRLYRFVELP